MSIIAAVAGATAIVGFVSIWIKMGVERGESKKSIETIERRVGKNEEAISELRNTTHGIQIEIARSVGKIEAKLDFITETVASLKGGRRAKEE